MDCIVVRVVVMERNEGEGDENVLSRSPSVRATVAVVPAPDFAVSEMVVSAVVPIVGARDFGRPWPSCDSVKDTFSLEVELFLEIGVDMGVNEDVCPLASPCWLERVGTEYGLFLTTPAFFTFCLDIVLSLCRFFKFARRFIQFAKGLRRACLSDL